MDRIWIRGTSGAGKTTLGRLLGERLGIEAVDLDDLFWLPEWRPRAPEDFLARVAAVAERPRWVMMGNYGAVRDAVGPRAEVVVWLDYPQPLTFARALRRTLRRGFTREPCCGGNHESMVKSFFTRKSILWWCLTTHARRRRECDAFMAETPPAGQIRLRHRSPRETLAWLRDSSPSPSSATC